MNSTLLQSRLEVFNGCRSMQDFGEIFIEALPRHLGSLKIPGRALFDNHRRGAVLAQVTQTVEIQNVMLEVLNDPITQEAQSYTESAFNVFLKNKMSTPVF